MLEDWFNFELKELKESKMLLFFLFVEVELFLLLLLIGFNYEAKSSDILIN